MKNRRLLSLLIALTLLISVSIAYADDSTDNYVEQGYSTIDVTRATAGDQISVTVTLKNLKYPDSGNYFVLERDPYTPNSTRITYTAPLSKVEGDVYKAIFTVDKSWKNGVYFLANLSMVNKNGERFESEYEDADGRRLADQQSVTIYGCEDGDQPVIKSITGSNQTVYNGDTFSFNLVIEGARDDLSGEFCVINKSSESDIEKKVKISKSDDNNYKATFKVDSSWPRGEYVVSSYRTEDSSYYQIIGKRDDDKYPFPEGYEETIVTVADKNTEPEPSETVTPSESPKPSETVKPSESPKPSEIVKPSESPNQVVAYSDVPTTGTWYSEAVYYATAKGYMAGTGNNKFSPDATVTRGTIAQILYAAEGKPAVSGKSQFTDVGETKWYAKAVKWAADKGLVSGYGNGKFGPEDRITREQMVAIMMQYSKMKGYDTSANADLSKFRDQNTISKWAVNAVKWGVSHKIVSGTDKGIEPKGNATRAQIAVILQAYDKNLRK